VVRRSRKPWIGVLVATSTMAPISLAGAAADQAPTPPSVTGRPYARVSSGTTNTPDTSTERPSGAIAISRML